MQPVDPIQTLLTGAVAAAVIGFLGALIGAWLQGRREHRRWVREQRVEACVTFMQVADRLPNLGKKPTKEGYTDELKNAYAALTLLCPYSVVMAGSKFMFFALARAERPPVYEREGFEGKGAIDTIVHLGTKDGSKVMKELTDYSAARLEFAEAAQAALDIDVRITRKERRRLEKRAKADTKSND